MMSLRNMFLVVISTVVFPFAAWAADERGNGGEVLVCGTDTPTYQMLDLYEAQTRSLILAFNHEDTTQDPIARVMTVIDGIASYDPTRAEKYRAWATSFMDSSESIFPSGVTLP